MYGGFEGRSDEDRAIDQGELAGLEDGERASLRLGHDVRFLFVAIGGGGIRIGREVARKHLRYVETIAIHCDPAVQGLEEFDRRVTLQAELGAEPEGPGGAGTLARAAEPALERIFEGAAFVTIVGSLGGASGTGLFPSIVEAASRAAVSVSVFAVKPFAAEGPRRGLAERALGRLPFVEAFVEKQQRGHARLQVLDNEALARHSPGMPFNELARHWADLVGGYMENAYVRPAEAALALTALSQVGDLEPMNRSPCDPPGLGPEPAARAPEEPRPMPESLPAAAFRRDAELTFEIDLSGAPLPRI